MKKTKRFIARIVALALAVLMIASVAPIIYAAGPEVIILNGERTAFVAGFGRMNYEGKAYQAYKTFSEGLNALGTEGGRLIISGEMRMDEFVDIEGRAPIAIVGVGTKNTANTLRFSEATKTLDLKGDLTLDFLTIYARGGLTINTNGHNLYTTVDYDTHYHIPDYTTGIRSYFAYPDLSFGGSVATINQGRFSKLFASNAGKVDASSNIIINDGVYGDIYAGGYGELSPTINGDIRIKITDGSYEGTVVAGPQSGTVNGNIFVDVLDVLTSNAISAGSDSGMVNGNVVVNFNNVLFNKVSSNTDNVSGKVILISQNDLYLSEGSKYDYYIRLPEGSAKPIFDGTNLLGFSFYDKTGGPVTAITVNGTAVSPVNGIFTLPEGKNTVAITSSVSLGLNSYAKFVSGYEDGTFLPQNNLSRAEAITMLSRLIVDETTIKGHVKSTFSDVESGSWYESYIGLFEGLGYLDTIAKNAGTSIDPNAKITRGEFVELARSVLRFLNPKEFGLKEFSDVPASHPYYKAIGQIGLLGIVGGYEDGTFKPDNNITRAEVVTIINRMLSRKATGAGGGTVFTDAVGHWAQEQILMAANPAIVDGAEIWKIDGNVTLGAFKLLEGDVTLDDQIKNLYAIGQTGDTFSTISGIDAVSDWQIDNIVYSESDYSTITGTKYYISPNGNDENDGLSPETAWQTLAKTNATIIKAGDGVLFERGAVFRGRINTKEGVTYSAYGVGEKPRFYGSPKNYADPALWEKDSKYENVWVLTDRISQDVGVIIFNSDYTIGNYNEIAGRKYVSTTARDAAGLNDDLQFFHYFGKLYVYSKTNPGERFHSIEIGSNGSQVVITGDNIVIDNLHFRYHGGHVIGTGNRKNITCKNSIFAYTGGSVLSGTTLYGNAFESYGGCDGWYAYNNWMYQIYDTGVTHQYTPTTGECIQKNVEYIGNVIEYCHWGIEYYNHDSTDGSTRIVDNVQMYNNIVRMTAYGWGSRGRGSYATGFCSAGITENTTNFVARRNILDRSQGRVFMVNSPGDYNLVLEENIYVQKEGGIFGDTKNGWISANSQAVEKLAEITVEAKPVVIINNDITIVNNIKNPTR